MDANQVFIGIATVSLFLFCLGFVKNKVAFFIRYLFRGGLGIVMVFFINAVFEVVKIPLFLGVNFCSISTIAFLGVPGVALLYGIVATRVL